MPRTNNLKGERNDYISNTSSNFCVLDFYVCDFGILSMTTALGVKELTAFANLVAEKERLECADICDSEATYDGIAQKCATAIRARGKK